MSCAAESRAFTPWILFQEMTGSIARVMVAAMVRALTNLRLTASDSRSHEVVMTPHYCR